MVLVSVVIPTMDRPLLLSRALKSVFNQTHPNIEVIVVVDRPNEETTAMLRAIDDRRLRVVVNPQPLNAAAARNLGVDHANGEWIAFLDDDDEWLPEKIAKQLALGSARGDVLVTCLSRIVTPTSSHILPGVIYDNSTPLDEYLFDRRSPFAGLGFMQTSSFLLPRSVFAKTRFAVDALHDDWDLALRLSKQMGLRIETVPEVLAVLYVDETRPTSNTRWTWAASLAWIDMLRPIITRPAYAGFCLGVTGPRAARERAYRAFFFLLYRAFKYGTPRPWRLCTFIGSWVLPHDAYRRLKTSMKSWTERGDLGDTSGARRAVEG